jgi:hypothetical protein
MVLFLHFIDDKSKVQVTDVESGISTAIRELANIDYQHFLKIV